jgi:leucyl-tRNA synthetase
VMKADPSIRVDARAYKMSKARGNVVNPDDIIKEHGADSLRLYEMFMGPLEAVKPWDTRSVGGVSRFLSRVWRLIVDEGAEKPILNASVSLEPADKETLRMLHKTIKRVTDDTESLSFNTAIAAMMEFSNHLTKMERRPKEVLDPFVQLLAPYAPHTAEELWAVLGHPKTLTYEIEIPVSINGKLKTRLLVPAATDQAELERIALADSKVQEQIAGKTIKKVIVVPRKMVNIVIGS